MINKKLAVHLHFYLLSSISTAMSATEILYLATQCSIYSPWFNIIFGLIGNIINLVVFTQLKLFRNNRSAFYITIETISNFLYELFFLCSSILTIIYGDDASGRSLFWCKFRYMLNHPLILMNGYMISCSAMDQYFSTNYRVYQRQICTIKLARIIVYTCIFVSIGHSIAFGLAYDIQPSVGCVISNPIWVHYSSYVYYPFIIGLLPICISSLFSVLAYRNVRRIVRRQIPIVRRRLDKQMTALVLIRVIMFVCLGLPYNTYRIYAINFPIPRIKAMEYAVGKLINSLFLFFVGLNFTVSLFKNHKSFE